MALLPCQGIRLDNGKPDHDRAASRTSHRTTIRLHPATEHNENLPHNPTATARRANFGKEGRPEQIVAKVSQGTLAEMIGTSHTAMALEALPDVPVYVDFTQRRLPGLVLSTGTGGSVRTERTRRHLADGIVDLRLHVNLGRGLIWFGRGREVILHPGDAVLSPVPRSASGSLSG
jgi:hypothetical protein